MKSETLILVMLGIVILGVGALFLFKQHQASLKPPVQPNSQNPNAANTICSAALGVGEKYATGASAPGGANSVLCSVGGKIVDYLSDTGQSCDTKANAAGYTGSNRQAFITDCLAATKKFAANLSVTTPKMSTTSSPLSLTSTATGTKLTKSTLSFG